MIDVILYILLGVVIFSMVGHRPTTKQIEKLLENGLVHVTKEEYTSSIQNRWAIHLKASSIFASYSTFGVRSAFFFCGEPTAFGRLFNFSGNDTIDSNVAVKLEKSVVLNLLSQNRIRIRPIDGAVIVKGEVRARGSIINL